MTSDFILAPPSPRSTPYSPVPFPKSSALHAQISRMHYPYVMRVLHTADFHAGRKLRDLDRTPEIRDALTEIAGLARTERADVVLVAGDLFDTVNPSAEAEGAVFDFFLRLRDLGVPCIVSAGNHDSATRLSALRELLGWVGVQVSAEVTPDAAGMVRGVKTAGGTELVVGALPYLSERRLVQARHVLQGDVGSWRQRYREGMAHFLSQLAGHFRPGAVNMLMLHAALDGAVPSGSERSFEFDGTNSYAVQPLALPAGAQYVAMGHVHKPQRVGSSDPPAYYPGSVIQLDFGEAGEQKSVNLVEVEPGRAARVHTVPLASGRELKTLRVSEATLESRLEALKGFSGHLKVVLDAAPGTAITGFKDRVLRLRPDAVAVELRAAEGETVAAPHADRAGLSRLQLFERYCKEEVGTPLSDTVRAAYLEAEAHAERGAEVAAGESQPAGVKA